jgi:ABC-type amino acid transport substrate-binding protein
MAGNSLASSRHLQRHAHAEHSAGPTRSAVGSYGVKKTVAARLLWRFFIPTAWLALCLTTPLVTAGEACKLLIASGNPQYPPYLWQDLADETRLIGANADLLQLLAKELGLPISTRYVGPWARVQEETRAGRVDLIAGAFWTAARTDYMDYFYPPFHATRSVVWVRTAATVSITPAGMIWSACKA